MMNSSMQSDVIEPTVACTICEILLLMSVSIRDTMVQTFHFRVNSIITVPIKKC